MLVVLLVPACAAELGRPTPIYEGPTAGGGETPAPTGSTSSTTKPADAPPSGTIGSEGLRLSVHTTLGIPEHAAVDDPAHALLVKSEYVASYDSQRKNPRWTSWELTTEWLGAADRSPKFVHDPDLSSTFGQATASDFTNSGLHQGHLCPSADRTRSDAVNAATFVFTNVVPQSPASNLGPWKTLETQERTFATEGKRIFVIAGSLYDTARTIGDGVAVPSSMFKVVVALEGANAGPADVTTSTRVIAVEIPNTEAVSGNYRNYRTTIADLERRTSLHLLSDIAPMVHDELATLRDDL